MVQEKDCTVEPKVPKTNEELFSEAMKSQSEMVKRLVENFAAGRGQLVELFLLQRSHVR